MGKYQFQKPNHWLINNCKTKMSTNSVSKFKIICQEVDNMFIVYFRIISELSTHGQTDGI